MKKTIYAAALAALVSTAAQAQEDFSGRLIVRARWTNTLTVGASTVTETLSSLLDQTHASGTNANEMNAFLRAAWTLTNSETRTISFAAATNSFGNAMDIYRVNVFAVKAATTNIGVVKVGADTFASWANGDDEAEFIVRPSGLVLFSSPDATGYASSGKVFRVTNGSTNDATIEIYIGGAK